ncbi:NfeD family protein [Aeoliella sp. SH292]|uniref:NfeD family protein n=1 Tax=Aeoliella sp. SH292 TaxID=3454464 RepID=UPI003F9B2978
MHLVLIAYFLLGCVCCYLVGKSAAKSKVSSTFFEALQTFQLAIATAALVFWPLFIVNDVLFYIPRQRKERLQHLRDLRKTAHCRRLAETKHQSIIGRTGFASTDLRLAGEVIIDDQQWMATSSYGHIPSGTPVVVVNRQGTRLYVRPVEPSHAGNYR